MNNQFLELTPENLEIARTPNSLKIGRYKIDLSIERGITNDTEILSVPASLVIHSEPRPDAGIAVISVDKGATKAKGPMPNEFFVAPGTARNIPFTQIAIQNTAQPGSFLYLSISAEVELTSQVNDAALLQSDLNNRAVEVVESDTPRKYVRERPLPEGSNLNQRFAGFYDDELRNYLLLTHQHKPGGQGSGNYYWENSSTERASGATAGGSAAGIYTIPVHWPMPVVSYARFFYILTAAVVIWDSTAARYMTPINANAYLAREWPENDPYDVLDNKCLDYLPTVETRFIDATNAGSYDNGEGKNLVLTTKPIPFINDYDKICLSLQYYKDSTTAPNINYQVDLTFNFLRAG